MADSSGRADGYRAFHAPRFEYLAGLVERYAAPGARVLDIGLSPFIDVLRARVRAPVDTLGLERSSPFAGERHFSFDLTTLAQGEEPYGMPRYGVIVFAEVLEHLAVSPRLPLGFFSRHLQDDGVLILQTPNAASLNKRVKLLLGRNPYELIRDDRTNPGHFREYTLAELREFARAAALDVVAVDRRYYFDARFAHHGDDGSAGRPQPISGAIKNAIYSALPPPLREGLTLVLRHH